jgi:homocysteine S-methyltransferase
MNFTERIRGGGLILTEGAVIERLRRDPSVELDPDVLSAGLPFHPEGRAALARIHREYLDIAAATGLPMVIGPPTWRANPERVARSLGRSCEEVNREGTRLVQQVREEYGETSSRVYVCGLMTCRGDAYDPADALSAEEAEAFHGEQARALAAAGVDYLQPTTLPSAPEALGLARALAATGMPYVLSFILRPAGTLLDGTPLADAMARIDDTVVPPPLCYWVNCVHPDVFLKALRRPRNDTPALRRRLVGLQANTSRLTPEELDGREDLDTADPASFADAMLRLHRELGMRVLGGCCGTDARHIRLLADRLRSAAPGGA